MRVSWSRAFLPSDLDLTFSSLIQRRIEFTHLLLAQALHSSTCCPYRSSLGIEILNSSLRRTNPGDGLDSSSYKLVTSFPIPYPKLTLTLSSPACNRTYPSPSSSPRSAAVRVLFCSSPKYHQRIVMANMQGCYPSHLAHHPLNLPACPLSKCL